MYSCDVSSLYTLIPTELGIEATNYWLHQKRQLIPQQFRNNIINKPLKFVLKKQQCFI